MIPIVTPGEMAEVDARAAEPVEILIERAGAAVAWAARRHLGGLYGRRIAVLAGPGNNGADGRVAARRLRRWGAQVVELDPHVRAVPACDLVIDAGYGTGLSRPYRAPAVAAPVLAVDIASGVNGLTGEILGDPLAAARTVTFQALKPGLLLHPGAAFAGVVSVVDLGLELGDCRAGLIEAADVADILPERAPTAHKWRAACWVIAGSGTMPGAAQLAAGAASRAGAGYVRLSIPGGAPATGPIEAVHHPLPASAWGAELAGHERFGAVVVGPGLGRDPDTLSAVRAAAAVPIPVVIDGDGLHAFAGAAAMLASRPIPAVLTPHDGEFEALTGSRPGPDRIASARGLAATAGAVVLLKGPATIVAEPGGQVIVSTAGDERLATAGTGDVLAGIIGALLAQGVQPIEAAAAGAWLHGRSATHGPERGMVASDLLALLPEVLRASDLG